jgi:hypothetical protein
MNDFVNLVQWSAITLLLFFSGFELSSQVVANHMQWTQLDWSFQLISWLSCALIYQCIKHCFFSIKSP